MSVSLGIDVGTTWCRACWLAGGAMRELAVPTVVALDPRDVLVAGPEALAIAGRSPHRAIPFAFRLLGRKLYGPEATWLAGASPVELVPSDNGDAWVRLGERRVSPEELMATVLRRVVSLAEREAGRTIDRVVIAAPAMLDLPQRHALLHAAELLGLPVLRVVESAAAALYATSPPPHIQTVVVADFGGGSFDVCTLRRRQTGWSVLGADGDPLLGGDDLDRRTVDALIGTFYDAHGADLTHSPTALYRLRAFARDLRHRAATKEKREPVHIPSIAHVDGADVDLHHPGFSASELEELWDEELGGFWPACAGLFDSVGLGTDDVDALYLIGGASRLPPIVSLFEETFRRTPLRPRGADLLAARGAATLATQVGGGLDAVRSCFPHALSVKVRDGRASRVSARNTLLPVSAGRMFAAAPTHQQLLPFEVYQGDAALARDNLYLGRFMLHAAPSQRHYVRFKVDVCGRLSVEATASGSGRAVPIEARSSAGLSPDAWAEIASRLSQLETPVPSDVIDDEPTLEAEQVPKRAAAPTPRVPTTSGHDPLTLEPESHPSSSQRRRRPPTRETRTPLEARDGSHSLPARSSDRPSTSSPPSSSTLDAEALIGATIGERYLIQGVIAEGGMGRVYHATHKILDREYAVKVIHPELATNPTLVKRFVREAKAAARIKSDHVVAILDFGELPDGTSYFVMEYLDGMSLEQALDGGVMPLPELLSVGIQMAQGLSAAHQLGIVHRDLKPANVLLLPFGEGVLVKILDFGIAKIPTSDGEGLTLVDTIVGTPHYMAPEQVGGKVDARTDIYALGTVLYEMLTRHPPFEDESLALVLAKHRTDAPKRPTDVVGRRCPQELEAVVLRCLEKHPDARFQSADDVIAALTEVVQRLPR